MLYEVITPIDALHRAILDELLERFAIRGLSEAEIDHLNRNNFV